MARIDLRLNDVKDSDIVEALNNVKNVSEEVRKLLRLGISVRYNTSVTIIEPPKKLPPVKKSKPKELSKDNIEELQQNLMSIDFGFDDE